MAFSKLLSPKLIIGCSVVASVSFILCYKSNYVRKLTDIFKMWLNPLGNQDINVISNKNDNLKEIFAVVKRHLDECPCLGFDCEWVSVKGKRRPVALLQLATHRNFCLLVQMSHLDEFPAEFKRILEDPLVFKVGVSPIQDANYLTKDYGIVVKGCFDLRHLTRTAYGLAHMSKKYFNFEMTKNWKIRCSDWETKHLSEKQISYAAYDAVVAVQLFKKLTKRNSYGVDVIPFLDIGYSCKNSNKIANSKFSVSTRDSKKKSKICLRKKPLYNNCYMEAPDGELLCTCDEGKAKWYVSKQLADIICKSPFTIRLRFEPAGRAVGDVGRYYTIVKENRCVVCGRKDSYIKKNVVPREYRKLFPFIMKEHISHDVLLLCVSCHQRSNMADLGLRQKLAELCNAPIGTDTDVKVYDCPEARQLRSAARALLKNAEAIPENRRNELEKIILKHFPDQTELKKELLEKVQNTSVTIENNAYNSHANKVVEYFKQKGKDLYNSDNAEAGGLVELERMWREHFLSTMRPDYMPELWSVAHNKHRLEIRAKEGRVETDDLILAGVKTPQQINVS